MRRMNNQKEKNAQKKRARKQQIRRRNETRVTLEPAPPPYFLKQSRTLGTDMITFSHH